jgi:serine/threonine-protein phosphatase 2A regulatory subunit B''
MLDMIKPKCKDKISLADLKACKMTPIFFDTFFNLEKYLDHEQRDPFASQRDNENEVSNIIFKLFKNECWLNLYFYVNNQFQA